MPRVGSSTSRTSGLRASHFASTTFCWLPPDSSAAARATSGVRIDSWRRESSASAVSAARSTTPPRDSAVRFGSAMFAAIAKSSSSPCALRSSGTRQSPAAIAAATDPGGRVRPSTATWPPLTGSMPKTARASSVRPAPTRPASPRISPRCSVRSTRTFGLARVRRPEIPRTGTPRAGSARGSARARSRPIISRTTRSRLIRSRASAPLTRPSRRTTTRSATASISARRWLTNSTATPSARSCAITASRRRVSAMVRLEVGSSRITSRARIDRARAISSICRSASDKSATGSSAPKRVPSIFRIGVTARTIAARSSRPGHPRRISRPKSTLPATSRLSKGLSS